MKAIKTTFILTLTLLIFTACSQLSLEEKNAQRQEIDKMAQVTIDTLSKEKPEILTSLKEAKGYIVVNWKTTKVPIVGAGGSTGVLVDQRDNSRLYIKVKRFDIGPGVGAKSFKNLVIINDDAYLDKAKGGMFKFEAGAEVTAGTASSAGKSEPSDPKLETHMLLDGGGAATATLRAFKSSLDSDLN